MTMDPCLDIHDQTKLRSEGVTWNQRKSHIAGQPVDQDMREVPYYIREASALLMEAKKTYQDLQLPTGRQDLLTPISSCFHNPSSEQ